ncbi:MAG: 50S ribosomal protein L11 methyltransferase [Thermoanaerobaculia bacterium]|nr:50S ribosomal protein L11 methyltransferase [Thermoanaerobaculia bacterium]
MALERYFYRVPAEAEDDAVFELTERGSEGVQVFALGPGEVRIEAYFSTPPEDLELAGAEFLGKEPVPKVDWFAAWRELARPFAVGKSLWFDPREPGEKEKAEELGREEESRGERTEFRFPARAAFGTGSHESTRLALELLEETETLDKRVLDVGTGTGILAIVALARGAKSAEAFDNDAAAPFHARVNAVLNPTLSAPRFFAGTLEALVMDRRYDLALVNIIPEVFIPELPHLAPLMVLGGEAIFSGILGVKAEEVSAALRSHGFEPVAERRDGEWIAFRTVFQPSC